MFLLTRHRLSMRNINLVRFHPACDMFKSASVGVTKLYRELYHKKGPPKLAEDKHDIISKYKQKDVIFYALKNNHYIRDVYHVNITE